MASVNPGGHSRHREQEEPLVGASSRWEPFEHSDLFNRLSKLPTFPTRWMLTPCVSEEMSQRRNARPSRTASNHNMGSQFGERRDKTVDINAIEDFDYCYVFELDPDDKRPLDAVAALTYKTRICRHLKLETHANPENRQLPPIYRTRAESDSTGTHTWAEFRLEMFIILLRVLRHMGCDLEAFVGCEDNLVFLKTRLQEGAAKRIASKLDYALQMDRRAAGLEMSNASAIPPYVGYLDVIEGSHRVKAKIDIGRVWARYDRLGRLVTDTNFSPEALERNVELSIFRDTDRIRLLDHELSEYISSAHLEHLGILRAHYPTTQPEQLKQLEKWGSPSTAYRSDQPLDLIRDYYGEEIAFYFAWMDKYTRDLWIPSIWGLVVFSCQCLYDPQLKFKTPWLNSMTIIFSVFQCVWITLMVQSWSQKEGLLSLKWGTSLLTRQQTHKEERTQFIEGGYTQHPVYPDQKIRKPSPAMQNLRLSVSVVITVLAVVACAATVNSDVQDIVLKYLGLPMNEDNDDEPRLFDNLVDMHSFVCALLVLVFERLYNVVASWSVRFENWQYAHQHRESLATRIFIFNAIDYFSGMFYTAFLRTIISHEGEDLSLRVLRRDLVNLIVLSLVFNVFEVSMPYLSYLWRRREAKEANVRIEKDFYLEEYEDTLDDYMEVVNQLGLVLFFSQVFPLAPFICMIAAHIEIAVDASKMVRLYRRPFPRGARDIGFWRYILQFMELTTLLLNVALSVFCTVGYNCSFYDKLVLSLVLIVVSFGVKELIVMLVAHESDTEKVHRQKMKVLMRNAFWGKNDLNLGFVISSSQC